MVGELKKQKYVYYHCTGYKGKCNEPYTREEVLEDQFASFLRKLRFDDEVFDWVSRALKDSCADEKREHAEAIARLEKERARLQQRIEQAINQYGAQAGMAIDLVISEVRSDMGAKAVNELVEEFDLELLYNIAPLDSDYSNS